MSIKRNLGGALNSLNRQVALVLFVPSCAKHPLYLLHFFCYSQPLAIARLATFSLRSSVARPTLSHLLALEHAHLSLVPKCCAQLSILSIVPSTGVRVFSHDVLSRESSRPHTLVLLL